MFENWFDWLKEHATIKVKSTFNPTTPLTPTVQEDPRTQQSIKNTRDAFKKQQFEMEARARKAHSAECKDPWACVSDPCFKIEPDKIVKSETVAADSYNKRRKKNIKLLRDMKK